MADQNKIAWIAVVNSEGECKMIETDIPAHLLYPVLPELRAILETQRAFEHKSLSIACSQCGQMAERVGDQFVHSNCPRGHAACWEEF